MSPFPGPSHDLCRGLERVSRFLALAISLQVLNFDFGARLLIMSQRRLTEQLARYWIWPTSEGQFPFPLAPEFWDSWLKTNLSAFDANAEQGSSSFEPL
jgi:hypothetical protein